MSDDLVETGVYGKFERQVLAELEYLFRCERIKTLLRPENREQLDRFIEGVDQIFRDANELKWVIGKSRSKREKFVNEMLAHQSRSHTNDLTEPQFIVRVELRRPDSRPELIVVQIHSKEQRDPSPERPYTSVEEEFYPQEHRSPLFLLTAKGAEDLGNDLLRIAQESRDVE